jgi:acetyl esterase
MVPAQGGAGGLSKALSHFLLISATMEAGPLFVYMHGGGWAKGSTDAHDLAVYSLAKKLDQFLFVSVDYRLAPAHVFPAALDDVEAVYRFLVKHAVHELIDVDRIVVGGDSAGGQFQNQVDDQ